MDRPRLTRDESKARTRAQLLRAANRLFLRDGYTATSLAAIAQEAGLTKGAVYSNFESKEDLFLAVLQDSNDPEWTAPATVDAVEDLAGFGRHSSAQRPSRRHVAMFLELNAAALRSERTRRWVAGNSRRFFELLGERLRRLSGSEADPATLGLVAQSLYVGLLVHGAFTDDVDDDTFARAYALLEAL